MLKQVRQITTYGSATTITARMSCISFLSILYIALHLTLKVYFWSPEGIAEYKKLDKEYPKTIFDQDFEAFMKKIAYSIVYVNTIEELQRNIYKWSYKDEGSNQW